MSENKGSTDIAAKAAVWYTVSNILLRGISIFTAPIFTRLLTTSDYGITSNFFSWEAILMCFTGLGLGTAVIRGKVEFDKEYKHYLSSIQFLGLVWCTICITILLIGIEFWSSFMILDKTCIVMMAIYLLIAPSLSFGQIDIRFDYKYKENVAISVISTLTSVAAAAVGLIFLWQDRRYLGRIMGMILPTIIFGIYFLIRIFKQGRCFVNIEYWEYALKLSVPMIPHGLAMIILGQIDRIMIIKYCGESEAGIYSFGYTYAILLQLVTNAVGDAVQPQMYGLLKDGKENKVALDSYRLMITGVLLTIGIIGVGPEALRILGTESYFEARWVIFPVAVGTLIQYIYQFFGIVEIYSKKTIYMAIGSCGAAAINYLLNMLLIPKYGYIVAAYTTLISYGLLMVFHFVMARISYKKVVFTFVPILSITVLALVVGMIINMVYDVTLVRYVVLVIVVGVMAFVLRNELARVARSILSSKKK